MGWDHSAYKDEPKLRMSSAQRRRLGSTLDTAPADERERLMVETAYRRGFAQGFHLCTAAAHDGVAPATLVGWHSILEKWRATQHGGKVSLPPVLGLWPKSDGANDS